MAARDVVPGIPSEMAGLCGHCEKMRVGQQRRGRDARQLPDEQKVSEKEVWGDASHVTREWL